ncbi:hypothetical protein HU200_066459 [Digitaria exilis]|uniref:RWP-RK domain-containing protein n=1 Tax=Digitaria exilis TaxID=1010633 RepID=A0A835A1X7_9POAL|nr:hypothetical protein HU200_066459 [Digitaria exilis]
MSHDEAYDPDGDVSRYVKTPPLESHLLLTAPEDEPAVASHVGATEDVPAAVQTPPDANPASFGFPAPTNEVFENNQALTMDVQPPAQAYGFAKDPVPAAVHARIDPPSLEAIFDDIVLPNLENMSLYDQFMYDRDDVVGNTDAGNSSAEHTVPLIEEDLDFVPFIRGQLDCSNCRSVRDVLHESGKNTIAQIIPTYTSCLRQRMPEWVQNFIHNIVEMLKNDTSGQLKDSSNNINTPAANNNDPHKELELAMLKQIFSTAANTEAVAPEFAPGPSQLATTRNINADGILFDAGRPGLSPAILESCQASVQDGASGASDTDYNLLANKQRNRISQFSMEDIIRLMHMNREDAAKELNISSTSLKRLCRKNNTSRWPARKIIAINNKIKKLEEAAVRNVGATGLLAIKEKMDKLKLEMAQLYASVMKSIQDNQKHNNDGAGSSVSKQ